MVAWCLELHDLWISKAIAGREKDRACCDALLRLGAVLPGTLRERLSHIEGLDDAVTRAVADRISVRL